MSTKLRIIPIGGYDRIGMNMTLVQYNDTIIVVDCGSSFPRKKASGTELMIPDITYLEQNKEKIKGYVLTHGHEDHIGAVPYVLKRVPAPVYGLPLTGVLAKKKLEESGISDASVKVVREGQSLTLGELRVEMIRANHSIPDSAMAAVYSPVGTVIFTGDFKIDYSPIDGTMTDLRRLGSLGYKGILAVFSDSTNAAVSGSSLSEQKVADDLEAMINQHQDSRIILTSFASNIDRIKHLIRIAKRCHRKVVVFGGLINEIMNDTKQLGYMDIPDGVLIGADEMKQYSDDQLMIITSGNHGDAFSSLLEIANGTHKDISIHRKDVILFSSARKVGDSAVFTKVINLLERQGARVVYQEIHATGHACAEELKLLFGILQPKFVIPAHGEYYQRKAAGELAVSAGIKRENVFLIDNGDIWTVDKEEGLSAYVEGRVQVGERFAVGKGISEVDSDVIRDRMKLSENGLLMIVLTFESKTGRMVSDLRIIAKGFSDGKQSDTMSLIKGIIEDEISRNAIEKAGRDELKFTIPKRLEEFIQQRGGQVPVIIPVITRVVL